MTEKVELGGRLKSSINIIVAVLFVAEAKWNPVFDGAGIVHS
jgi:hypothetical protein